MIIPSILVIDDERNSLLGICQILTDEGYRVVPAKNGKTALEILKRDLISLVISDVEMPDLDGMELLDEVQKINLNIPVIFITAYGSVSMAVEALKKGAFYFFEKPIFNDLEKFFAIFRQALKPQQMKRERDDLVEEFSDKFSFPNIVGRHPKIIELIDIIGKVAKTDQTVLIQGESGTGKDLVAKTIHYNSRRKGKPLICVNCGALTESLMTSELFGHKKGAFTGAIDNTMGRFQMANGGTLVLDEIGEIPFHLQKIFLGVIEEKVFEKVGDSRSINVDVRILTTTNRDLREEIAKKNFREDLYYRLSTFSIKIPPLRERSSDIPLLARHFLKKLQDGSFPNEIEPDVIEHMKTHPWYGNVRELANTLHQMMISCKSNKITLHDLPFPVMSKEEKAEVGVGQEIQLMNMVSDLEKKWILEKLKESNWNKEKAAKLLGITRKMLINRINKYKLIPLKKPK